MQYGAFKLAVEALLWALPGTSIAQSDLGCIEPERVGCGCWIRVDGLSCRTPNYRQTHFFSALHQGAPLWLNYDGRDVSLPSVKPVEPVFQRSRGDSWSEEYRASDMTVIIRYRPAPSTCPADKGADGCEYFDVAAEIVLRANRNTRQYSGRGSCGC